MCKALEIHWQRAPPVYEAQRLAAGPLTIDGDLDKPEWRAALWSAPFDDIRGAADAPVGARPAPGCQTRFKMLWDDEFLYVAALLEYDADMPVIATFTQRNSPIFHEDSDFEVRPGTPRPAPLASRRRPELAWYSWTSVPRRRYAPTRTRRAAITSSPTGILSPLPSLYSLTPTAHPPRAGIPRPRLLLPQLQGARAQCPQHCLELDVGQAVRRRRL